MGKYTVPTGDGYQGVATVGISRSVNFGVGMFDVDWRGGDRVFAIQEDVGVRLTPNMNRREESFAVYTVSKSSVGPSISVAGRALEVLGAAAGDDVRAYKRDDDGLILVRSKDDPFVEE